PRAPEIAIEEPDSKKLEAVALARRSELRAAERAIARSQATVEGAERASLWPAFMVGADYMLMPLHAEPHHYGASIALSLPWLNPQHREELRGAEQTLGADRRARESAENMVRYQVHDAVARYN